MKDLPKDAHILEIGGGIGWVGEYLRANGWPNYLGLDIEPPCDILGDIKQWRSLGLTANSFDIIIAFEVVEHVNCFQECYDLLKPGGRMLLTTPLPHMDWFMKMLEILGLNQKRTDEHDCLVYLNKVNEFENKQVRVIGGLSQ